MIYNNTFPWLSKRQNNYNKHTAHIQLFSTAVSREGIYEKRTIKDLETSTTHSPLNPEK
jgi:hypothetical protein